MKSHLESIFHEWIYGEGADFEDCIHTHVELFQVPIIDLTIYILLMTFVGGMFIPQKMITFTSKEEAYTYLDEMGASILK